MSHVFRTSLTVRGYECRQQAIVGLPTLLSYFEHCRWEWILVPELGLVQALHDGHFFVVHRATLGLCRGFGIGTKVTVRAALRRVGRVNCVVEQDVIRDDGVRLARATIDAIWLNGNGRMTRVPNVTRSAVTEEPLDAEDAPPSPGREGSFLAPPERTYTPTLTQHITREIPASATVTSLSVRASDCDLHQHVNNATYLHYFEDAFGAPTGEADVEYRGQARAGDTLAMHQWEAGEGRRAYGLLRDDEVICRAVLSPRSA